MAKQLSTPASDPDTTTESLSALVMAIDTLNQIFWSHCDNVFEKDEWTDAHAQIVQTCDAHVALTRSLMKIAMMSKMLATMPKRRISGEQGLAATMKMSRSGIIDY
ncbi:hypothetical protein HYZ99_05120, partial [Candidatus Peregrinibacteria bacterium]|nr:hypothetical protein [Candidatus Peregrinibacteria bacterium]